MIRFDEEWKRAALRRFALTGALFVVGAVVLAVAGSTAMRLVAAAILGTAGTIAVALVFMEVGLSEDRERAREERERERRR